MKSWFASALPLAIALGWITSAEALAFPDNQPIGLLSKVILNVTLKAEGKDWEKASRGQTLSSGDILRTAAQSFAIIKFKDNSLVRVRELSEVTITGSTKDRAFSKSIEVQSGGVGFNVSKQQQNEEFRFTSPTSVASIRGTGGLFVVGSTDTLIVIEGTVTLLNTISTESVTVQAGFTGVSSRDGKISTRPATQQERKNAEETMKATDQPRQLKLQLRNSRGETKELILDFKE